MAHQDIDKHKKTPVNVLVAEIHMGGTKSTETKGGSYQKAEHVRLSFEFCNYFLSKNHMQRAEILTMRRHRSYSKLEVHHAKSMVSSHEERQEKTNIASSISTTPKQQQPGGS